MSFHCQLVDFLPVPGCNHCNVCLHCTWTLWSLIRCFHLVPNRSWSLGPDIDHTQNDDNQSAQYMNDRFSLQDSGFLLLVHTRLYSLNVGIVHDEAIFRFRRSVFVRAFDDTLNITWGRWPQIRADRKWHIDTKIGNITPFAQPICLRYIIAN